MTDIITLLYNNGKSAFYTGGNINRIYHYLEMIGYPTTVTTSGQRSCHFGPSSLINNDTASLQPVIESIRTRQNIICEYCGIIVHKADACILCGSKSLPPILRKKKDQSNTLHG